MPAAPDTQTPKPVVMTEPRREPVLHPSSRSTASPLPASIAGAFAAAQHSLQHSLQNNVPPEEDTGLLPQLYASLLGPRSRDYYLAQFKRFDALDRSLPSWNMAAAFFTLAWCCLRGLWREAAQYLAGIAAVALLWWWGLRPALPTAMALGLGVALWLAAVAVPGLLGNGWLWRKTKAQTLQAIAAAPNMAQAHAALQALASPAHHRLAAILVLALPLAAATGAGLALLPLHNAAPAKVQIPAQAQAPAQPSTIAPLAATATATGTATAAAVPKANEPAEKPATPATASPPALTPAATVVPSPLTTAPVPAPALAQTEPTQATSPSPEPPAMPPTAVATHSDLETGKFYLNVGVYSDPANASKVLAQLQQSRLPVLTQQLPSNKGEITRVRSGPFESRKKAERAARKLQAKNIEATVFQPSGHASH